MRQKPPRSFLRSTDQTGSTSPNGSNLRVGLASPGQMGGHLTGMTLNGDEGTPYMSQASGGNFSSLAQDNNRHTTVRYRGKRFDQVSTAKASLNKTDAEEKKMQERRKMIQRSNERLRMLDEMGK